MNEALLDILGAAELLFLPFLLVFLRVGAALAALPVFGEQMISVRVRLSVMIMFSAIVFPAVFPNFELPTDAALIYLGFAEIVIGLAIGILLRLHIMALQIAATIAAQSTSLSQLLGGSAVDPQPAIGVFLYMAALALAVELGLHVQFALMFINSYDVISVGELIGTQVSSIFAGAVSHSFEFGFILAAPFVAASLIYNLALGVINRAMPQLMVAFVGAPAITYGALVLLALTAPLMLALWVESLQHLIVNPFRSR